MDTKEKLWNLFFANLDNEHFPQALEALKQLSGIEPHNPQIYLRLGDLYQKTHESDKAVSSYFEAAAILEEEGFCNKALALHKMILRIEPGNEPARDKINKAVDEIKSLSGGPAGPLRCEASKAGKHSAPGQPAPPHSEISLFESLSKSEMDELNSKAEKLIFSENSTIVNEGDTGNSLYIVKKGILMVVTHIMGETVELGKLSEGDIFGEIAFLTGRPRTASITAATNAEVMEIKEHVLKELISKHPKINNMLRGFYESRVQETIHKIKGHLTA
ncbi:MAG: cyclic nucleotide-binding domain-containing protein [Nitrospirota bacterium]